MSFCLRGNIRRVPYCILGSAGFAVGHGKFAPVNSLAVVVNPSNALYCYGPMPFRKHGRVTLTNESRDKDLTLLAVNGYIKGQAINVDSGLCIS